MTTYTRESLNKMKEEFELEEYNKQINRGVNYIEQCVISTAKCEDHKECNIRVIIIGVDEIPPLGERDVIIINDTKKINDIIAKLKTIFVDVPIEYVDKTIRINWA